MGNPNDAALWHLKNQMDLLSDNHSEITNEAARISVSLLRDHISTARVNLSRAALTRLSDALEAHSARCLRARDEVRQIRNNLKVT
jgi:hypothetical protein